MNKKKIFLTLTLTFSTSFASIMSSDAAIANGWQKSDGNWNYYSNGEKRIGWIKDNRTWYYLDKVGIMKTGWVNDNGVWYYLKDTGAMATGWIKYDEEWYYLNSDGAMKTGWIKYKDKWYYLNNDGTMKCGMLRINDKLYYLDDDGIMQTGWFKAHTEYSYEDLWYYADEDGAIKEGWVNSNNKWYYIGEDGMYTNKFVDGYYINRDGIWDTSYDNKISVSVQKSEYSVKANQIKVLVVNGTNDSSKYDKEIILQQYKDNSWITVSNYKNDEALGKVNGKSISYINIISSDLKEKLECGQYRVGVKVNNEYLYSDFKVIEKSDNNPFVMSLEKTSYPVGTDNIPYKITNTSNRKYWYTYGERIEKFEDNKWKQLEYKSVDMPSVELNVKGGESFTGSANLYEIEGELKSGKYRVVKDMGGYICCSEFELTGEKEPSVEIEAKTDTYSITKDKKIEFIMKNNTNNDLECNKYAELRRKNEKDNWMYYKAVECNFNNTKKYILKGNSTDKFEISLDNDKKF